MPRLGNAADRTAAPQPPKVSQNVPKNSAVVRRMRSLFIASSPSIIRVQKIHTTLRRPRRSHIQKAPRTKRVGWAIDPEIAEKVHRRRNAPRGDSIFP